MGAPLNIDGNIDEIRAAVGILAMLHAVDELSAADMRAAVTCIETELALIELATQRPQVTVPSVVLPLLRLGDVARYRTPGTAPRPARPALRVVEGGAA